MLLRRHRPRLGHGGLIIYSAALNAMEDGTARAAPDLQAHQRRPCPIIAQRGAPADGHREGGRPDPGRRRGLRARPRGLACPAPGCTDPYASLAAAHWLRADHLPAGDQQATRPARPRPVLRLRPREHVPRRDEGRRGRRCRPRSRSRRRSGSPSSTRSRRPSRSAARCSRAARATRARCTWRRASYPNDRLPPTGATSRRSPRRDCDGTSAHGRLDGLLADREHRDAAARFPADPPALRRPRARHGRRRPRRAAQHRALRLRT